MSRLVSFTCANCMGEGRQKSSSVYRSKRNGAPLYCSRVCAGIARRKGKSIEQKRAEKALYDKQYRQQNLTEIKAKKAARYRTRIRDLEKEREVRKRRMPYHVEYCRRPEYKAKKKEYDKLRTDVAYGEYAECNRLLMQIESLIRLRMTKYERACAKGYYERQRQRRNANV